MAEKISVYNLADLKNTSDDALPNYLNSLKFKQSHTLTDVRLALGYGAFAISAACFFWDYKLGFENTKLYTAIAVAIYFALNGALTLWIMRVEKGIVYQATAPSGEKISISSSTKKNDPTYYLTATVTSNKAEPKEYKLSPGFNTFFDETGLYVAHPFQVALATAIPLVGQYDPKRIKAASQDLLDTNPELLDAVLAANTSGAETTDKSGGKRRKA